MSEKQSQLSPVEQPAETTSVFDVFKEFGAAGQAVSNFAGNPNQMMKLVALATSGGGESGGNHVGDTIEFSHWYVHPVEIEDSEGGEMRTCPRVVLIDRAGTAYQFVSFGIYQSLRVILQFLGTGKLEPPARVVIRQRSTRKGFRVLFLEPVVTD